jgi:hypothetical protein
LRTITSSTLRGSDRPRAPRSRLVEQAVESVLGKPGAPRGSRRARDAQTLADLGVLEAFGRQQHDRDRWASA